MICKNAQICSSPCHAETWYQKLNYSSFFSIRYFNTLCTKKNIWQNITNITWVIWFEVYKLLFDYNYRLLLNKEYYKMIKNYNYYNIWVSKELFIRFCCYMLMRFTLLPHFTGPWQQRILYFQFIYFFFEFYIISIIQFSHECMKLETKN